jgi:hypothetical protein
MIGVSIVLTEAYTNWVQKSSVPAAIRRSVDPFGLPKSAHGTQAANEKNLQGSIALSCQRADK